VRNPRLDGADLFAPHTAVGLTPVVSWDAPTTGTPTSYSIVVFRVDANNGGTKVTRTATLTTRATSLRLPAGVLTHGSSFVMSINADVVPSQTTTKPFRTTLPDARSTVITAQFQP